MPDRHAPPAIFDCLIVGGGPAGLTAALYLRRYHRRVLLADAGCSRALWIDRTHNLPGFPDGVPGAELLQRMRRQLAEVGGEVVPAEVTQLELLADETLPHEVAQAVGHTTPAGRTLRRFMQFSARVDGQAVQARSVVLATGVVDGVPLLPGMDEIRRVGLLRQCPICDGHEHRAHSIVVIGDGEHGEREAHFIANYSPRVTLVPPAAARRVDLREGGGVRLALHDGSTLEADVLYAALGVRPRNALALALGAEHDEIGGIVVDALCQTSVPGLYAAGDVVSGLDQLTVAAAHGAITATAIHNRLPALRTGSVQRVGAEAAPAAVATSA